MCVMGCASRPANGGLGHAVTDPAADGILAGRSAGSVHAGAVTPYAERPTWTRSWSAA